jgi:hypothetical protein
MNPGRSLKRLLDHSTEAGTGHKAKDGCMHACMKNDINNDDDYVHFL